MKHGIMGAVIIMQKLIIDESCDNQRIDKYLKKVLNRAPSSLIYKMLRKKDIKVNGKRVKENYIVHTGDVVEMFLYDDKFAQYASPQTIYDLPVTFDVIYEDEHILIVNKPAGLLVHEDAHESLNTLDHQVLNYLYQKGDYDPAIDRGFIPGPVHRLDRNTSGLVIFGKDLHALQDLNEMMKKRHCVEKTYLTIVKGRVQDAHLTGYVKKDSDEARVHFVKPDVAGAKYMETIVKAKEVNKECSLVEVTLVTGRTHQIRIHMASVDHPVMGDSKYGDFNWNRQIKQRYHLNHQLLHAYKLMMTDPIGSMRYLKGKTFIAPLPEQFRKIKNSCF